MANLTSIRTLMLLISICLIQSCKEKYNEISWEYDSTDILGKIPEKSNSIDLDVYLDATASMEGFAVSNTSNYSEFLDELESSANTGWNKADVDYFKFGARVKPIERSEFLHAQNTVNFYREKGIFEKTFIDSVIVNTNPSRLTVLITDLFREDSDINIMINTLKDKCLSKGVEVGLLGIESQFNGRVYDVPGYQHGYILEAPARPFYAILFGNSSNMKILFESLKSMPFVKEENFSVFSNRVVHTVNVSAVKTKDSKYVNKIAPTTNGQNVFDFSMKQEGKAAKFDIILDINRNDNAPDFNENNIEWVVYKKSILDSKTTKPDSISSKDITVENLRRDGDKILATLILNNEDPNGNYSYAIYLKSNQINGLKIPSWINSFSTDNPMPGSPSAARTYNLEKFISRLISANASINPVYLGKFYINIFKR